MNGLILQHAGQGDASINPALDTSHFARRLDQIDAEKARKAAAEKKAKEERDKQFEENRKWNPDKAWIHHMDQFDGAVKDVIDYNTDLEKKGTMPTPDEQRTLQEKKWNAEVIAKKSNDIQKLYDKEVSNINGMDAYTDKTTLKSELNDEVLGVDHKKDVHKVDINRISQIPNNPKAFLIGKYTQDFDKNIDDKVTSVIGSMQMSGQDLLVDKEVKSKYYDIDANGNPKVDPKTGKNIIKISPETINLYLENPRVRAKVEDMKVNDPEYKDLNESQIATKLLAAHANVQAKNSFTKLSDGDETKKGDDPVISVVSDVERNRNILNRYTNKYETLNGWVPMEADLNPEKFKDIPLNPNNSVNVENNKDHNTKRAGNEKFTLTKLLYLPVDSNTGQRIHTDKANVLNLKGIVYKPFVEAVRTEEKYGEKKNITELFHYDQAKSYLEAKGVNLNKIGFNDPQGLKYKKPSTSDKPGVSKKKKSKVSL